MTISVVQSSDNAFTDVGASVSKAFTTNVTAGDLIVVYLAAYTPVAPSWAAGSCTKSAGTATLGAITLDASAQNNITGTVYQSACVWSAKVTGSGSLTINVAATDNSYLALAIAEYSASNGWDESAATRVEDFASATGETGGASSGTVTSAGGALLVGAAAVDTASATTITADTNWTVVFESEDGSTHETGSTAHRIVTSGTTDDFNLTAPTTVQWAAVAAVHKETAGGGSSQALEGAATAGATATGAVSVAKPLAGDAAAGAQASASLEGQVALEGAATGGAAASAALTVESRRFEFTLYEVDGATPLASKTGLWWAWWPSIAAVRTDPPDAQGTGASTNGSGVFTVGAPGTLSVGENQGFGIISDQDATPDATEAAYVGSFDVV